MLSFKDVYNDIYYDLIEQGYSEQKADEIALEGANDAFTTMADVLYDQMKDNELLRS